MIILHRVSSLNNALFKIVSAFELSPPIAKVLFQQMIISGLISLTSSKLISCPCLLSSILHQSL